MSSTDDTCETKSLKPMWVTIGFASMSFLMLIVTIVFSVKRVKSTPSRARRNTSPETQEYKAVDTKTDIDDEKGNKPHSQDQSDEKEQSHDSHHEVSKKEDSPHSFGALVSAAIDDAKDESIDDPKEEEPTNAQDKTNTIDIDHKPDANGNNDKDETQSSAKSEWDNASGCMGKFKLCARDVWGRKSVYLPIVSHLSDTTTDFASVVEFGIVASTSNPKTCGVNVWYLFTLSIICMLTYRVISSFKVYQITRSPRRAFFQMLDIEIFRVLYLSHYMGLKGKSSPHRLLCVLEAVFEAAPQSVIQMVYLMFTGIRSPVIITSCILSFFTLTLSIVSDDAKLLRIGFSKPSLQAVPHKTDKNRYSDKPLMHHPFLEFALLYTYRILDVPSQLLLYAFLWYYVHGAVCFAVLAVDILIALGLYYKTQNTDTLLSVIAVPFTLKTRALAMGYWKFAILETIILIVTIWSGLAVTKRLDFIGLWIFCFLASLVKWIVGAAFLYFYLQVPRLKEEILNLDHTDESDVSWRQLYTMTIEMRSEFKEFVQLSREQSDLDALIAQGKYADSVELIMFRHSTVSQAARRVHGKKNEIFLLGTCDGIF
eukprot:115741_1